MSDPIQTYREHEEPSLETLSRYLKGEMTQDEQAEMEQYMEDYPMYADALEGLQMVQDPEMLHRRLRHLREDARKRLYTRTSKREKVQKRRSRVQPLNIPRYLGAAAAAIAALIIVFFVFDRTSRDEPPLETQTIAEAQEPVIEPESALADEQQEPYVGGIVVDSIESKDEPSVFPKASPEPRRRQTPSPAPKDIQQESVPSPESSVPVESLNRRNDVTPLDDQVEKPIENAVPPPPANRAQRADHENLSNLPSSSANEASEASEPTQVLPVPQPELEEEEREETEATPNVKNYLFAVPEKKRKRPGRTPKTEADFGVDDLPEQDKADQEFGETSKSAIMEDLLTHGLHLYDRQNYAEALHTFEELLRSDPGNPQASYYAGRSALQLEREDLAITLLDTLVSNKDNIYQDAALWFQAEALLRKNKSRRAIRLLRRLAKREGLYAIKARKRLEEVE